MANENETFISTNSIRYIDLGDGQGSRAIDAAAVGGKTIEQIGSLVTSISAEAKDTEYPSAKCMYNELSNIESRLRNI